MKYECISYMQWCMPTRKKECILLSYYHFHCKSCALSLPKGVVPTVPEQPTDEMGNQLKSPDPRPDAPPDYNSHFVPGTLSIRKGFFLSPMILIF